MSGMQRRKYSLKELKQKQREREQFHLDRMKILRQDVDMLISCSSTEMPSLTIFEICRKLSAEQDQIFMARQ